MRLTGLGGAILFCVFAVGSANSQPVLDGSSGNEKVLRNFSFKGRVTDVTDTMFQLDSSVTNGTPFEGYYIFDRTVSDSNPDPSVGDYWQRSHSSGVTVKVGPYVFRTHPEHVEFLVEVVNRDRDSYLLRSYYNVSSTGLPVSHISWQLDDPSGTAFQNDVLPVTLPDITNFQSLFGLSINGNGMNGFLIRGHITSLEETPVEIPTRPEITVVEAVELSFPTRLGYFYQVQYSYDLNTWTDTGSPLLGTSASVSTFVRKNGIRQTYYRAEIANTP